MKRPAASRPAASSKALPKARRLPGDDDHIEMTKKIAPRPYGVPRIYGSDCSGLDGGAIALENSRPAFVHEFSCEVDVAYNEVTRHVHPLCRYHYRDVTRRNFEEFAHVHRGTNIYTAGFPCQPFSKAGRKLGALDAEGRGLIIYFIIETIRVLLPTVFILENVMEITTPRFKAFFDEILLELGEISGGIYEVPGRSNRRDRHIV